MLGLIIAASAAVAFGGPLALGPAFAQAQAKEAPEKHFDAKGKQPSMYTIELRKGVSATLQRIVSA
ncbi:hypothetical protein [Rhodoblastus sp.]|uniref:hypothetical protein n=1 Tax=Rhodoblastus sp. TaxID=1962975 RepID=UPI003F999281